MSYTVLVRGLLVTCESIDDLTALLDWMAPKPEPTQPVGTNNRGDALRTVGDHIDKSGQG